MQTRLLLSELWSRGFGSRHYVNRSVSVIPGSCSDEMYVSFEIVHLCIHSREMVYISMRRLGLNEIVWSLKHIPLKEQRCSMQNINTSIDQKPINSVKLEPKDIPLSIHIESPIFPLKY